MIECRHNVYIEGCDGRCCAYCDKIASCTKRCTEWDTSSRGAGMWYGFDWRGYNGSLGCGERFSKMEEQRNGKYGTAFVITTREETDTSG